MLNMNIQKKRIRNPRRYLFGIPSDEQFYIAVPLKEEDREKLKTYGIFEGVPARIPKPRKTATCRNANGDWIPLKKAPKEMRTIFHDYHVVDWHGEDHYGTCAYPRQCFQRKFLPPTELAFVVEDGVLYSPALINDEEQMTETKIAMNVVLEMVGRFQIWNAEKAPALPPIVQKEVPWEILRSGTNDVERLKAYIRETSECKSATQQTQIRGRHEYLWRMKPAYCVLGTQNFWGYVVYAFPDDDLFIFECNEVNNATYIFRGDWKRASQLTKTEVLSSGAVESRIFHTTQWERNLSIRYDFLRRELA